MIIINLVLTILLINSFFGRNTNLIGCGIIGYSGFKDKVANPMILKFLLLYNEDRGKEACGFYSKETGIVKKEGEPRKLLSTSYFNIPITNQFIGHVRQGSSGGAGDAKAHPFKQGNIILAMNGTISNHYNLCLEYKVDTQPLWVDSDYLCAMLNKTQNKEPLTKIDGSCACVYIDDKTNIMYVYRNIDRPLFKGYKEEGMYISSTKESLLAICCNKIEEFKENRLYEIVNGSIIRTYNVKRYIKPVVDHSTSYSAFYDLDEKHMYRKANFSYINKPNLIGLWVQPNNDFFSCGASFSKNRRYEVVKDGSYCSALQFTVYHPGMGRDVLCEMRMFSDKIPTLDVKDFMFATQDIYFNDDSLFCKKGHLLVIDSIVNVVKVTSLTVRLSDSDTTCCFNHEFNNFIRPATKYETEEFWDRYSGESLINEYLKEKATIPVINTPTIVPYKPTVIEKYTDMLNETTIKTYDNLLDLVQKEMKEHIEDINNMGCDSYTQLIVDKMNCVMEYLKKSDIEYKHLNQVEEPYYGG